MLKGINYWAFPSGVDGNPADPVETMRYAKELGYGCFEFTVDDSGPLSFESTESEVRKLGSEAARLGIGLETLASGFAWGRSPTSSDTSVRTRAVESARKLIEIASWLGAGTILYIPGVVSASFVPEIGAEPYGETLAKATETLTELIPLAKRFGVRIGVENVWNRFLLDPVSMRNFIDSFESDVVGSYFDIGNAVLFGHPEDWIRTLEHRIFAVHMKDFRVEVGNLNGFVDLLAGDVDFAAVMKALEAVGYSGPHTVEYVPGALGAAEKNIAALRLIEKL